MRARQRAFGVMGQLRQLMWPGMAPGMAPGMTAGMPMVPQGGIPSMMGGMPSSMQSVMGMPTSVSGLVAGGGGNLQPAPLASAALAQALAQQQNQALTYYNSNMAMLATPQAGGRMAMVQLVGGVRERPAELKKKADTDSE